MEKENNIITEDLIISKLEERGVLKTYESNEELALSQIQDYFGFELTSTYDGRNHNVSFYEETTADSYSLWVIRYGNSSIDICENVYMYDTQMAEELCEVISNSYGVIYVDDIEQRWVQEALFETYEQYIINVKQEIEDELIDEGYELEQD
jgi:hypothetical protein